MFKYEFTGYVNKFSHTNYGDEIIVRADADERDAKFKQHLLISVTKKVSDKVPFDLGKDDKVKITFVPILNEGVSDKTKRAYAINKMMLSDIEVLEKASTDEGGDGDDASDIPF